MIYDKFEKDSAEKAAEYLKKGKIVIMPTDTVYGFSGIVDLSDADNLYKTDDVIRRIKGRSETKPLIQLIASPTDLRKYTDDVLPASLLNKWPGALTVIVSIKKNAPVNFETVAFRCPGDEWVRKVINLCDAPIYSTSVNRSGMPVLDTQSEIIKEFEKEVDFIIADGDKKNALPSTLVRIEEGKVIVIRQGSVSV